MKIDIKNIFRKCLSESDFLTFWPTIIPITAGITAKVERVASSDVSRLFFCRAKARPMVDRENSIPIAVVKSKTAANNPKLTVGSPSPITPFTPPANKKVPPIIIRVSVSIIKMNVLKL